MRPSPATTTEYSFSSHRTLLTRGTEHQQPGLGVYKVVQTSAVHTFELYDPAVPLLGGVEVLGAGAGLGLDLHAAVLVAVGVPQLATPPGPAPALLAHHVIVTRESTPCH